MWYRLQRMLVCLVALVAVGVSSTSANAGWWHRWGHHHHHHYYGGGYVGFGFPSYSYSSYYYSYPRARLFYPSYSVGYYRSYYYAPPVTVALPTYYYATPTYYVAPTYYAAPVVYPSAINCYDPCASVSSPSVSYPSTNSSYSLPEYSTGLPSSNYSISGQVASMSGGSFVDRMLGNVAATNTNTGRTVPATVARRDASVRTVSTLKPAVSTAASNAAVNQFEAIPTVLLKTADEMFANGGYAQAASAYARLAVRYGDHDELAVRRFIALIASGDHAQASIVYELSLANGRPLSMDALPAGGLGALYGSNARARESHVESLASYALRQENEATPLAMVGTWLVLDGQPQRASTFLKRAEMISKSSEASATTTLANRLADALLAR